MIISWLFDGYLAIISRILIVILRLCLVTLVFRIVSGSIQVKLPPKWGGLLSKWSADQYVELTGGLPSLTVTLPSNPNPNVEPPYPIVEPGPVTLPLIRGGTDIPGL